MVIPNDILKELEKFFWSLKRETIEEYIEYWDSVTPITPKDIFNRWIFASMSIHTSYELNVLQYKAIQKLKGKTNLKEISKCLKGGGMQNRKAQLVVNICKNKAHMKLPKEECLEMPTWRAWRKQMNDLLWGIGKAKISFVAEMLSPSTTDIVCLDRHILKAFGQDRESSPKEEDYHMMEDIWLDMSYKTYCPPAIARFIYWDNRIQNEPNSRYWSKTLEQ